MKRTVSRRRPRHRCWRRSSQQRPRSRPAERQGAVPLHRPVDGQDVDVRDRHGRRTATTRRSARCSGKSQEQTFATERQDRVPQLVARDSDEGRRSTTSPSATTSPSTSAPTAARRFETIEATAGRHRRRPRPEPGQAAASRSTSSAARFVSTGGGKVTIDVKGGNRRALRLLIGQTAQQTFSSGAETVFLHWAHRIPTVIDATQLKAGDRIVVRVRAAGGLDARRGRGDAGAGGSPTASRSRRKSNQNAQA